VNPAYDVLVLGDYCLDLIFTGLPKLPELGVEIVANGFDSVPGGGGFTCAVSLARLGLRVGWAVDFGDDAMSAFVRRRAIEEGLDASLFVDHARPLRRITVAASFPDDRAFLAYYDPDPPLPAAMRALAATSARIVFVPGIYHGPLLAPARAMLKLRGAKLAMDGNSTEDTTLEKASVRRAVGSADLFLPNALEARRLTGEADLGRAMARLLELCPLVIIKDGARGAYACARGEAIVHAPAIALEPLDTTGSGDAFDAGFIAAWLEGRPLTTCLAWGNIVGGHSTLGRGGTGVRTTRREVEARLGALHLS
jgi:sugar/nucleoside kinase (ribokinase family)